MTTAIITDRLRLVPATEDALTADLAGHDALASALDVTVARGWPPEFYDEDAIRYSRNWVRKQPLQSRWGMYYIVFENAGAGEPMLVGACGYKGPPAEDASVEIGYGVVAEFRRRGIASEAAAALTSAAFSDPQVDTVIAHTLVGLEGSIGVLEKLGFTFDGETSAPGAPEGATVIRYKLSREQHDESRRENRSR